jgi:hypothetical protein
MFTPEVLHRLCDSKTGHWPKVKYQLALHVLPAIISIYLLPYSVPIAFLFPIHAKSNNDIQNILITSEISSYNLRLFKERDRPAVRSIRDTHLSIDALRSII